MQNRCDYIFDQKPPFNQSPHDNDIIDDLQPGSLSTGFEKKYPDD